MGIRRTMSNHPTHVDSDTSETHVSAAPGARRTPGAADTIGSRKPLGALLLEEGATGEEALRAALRRQDDLGGQLGSILVAANGATSLAVAQAVAAQRGLPVANLLAARDTGAGAGMDHLDPALFRALPEGFWRDRLAVPVRREGDALEVAMVHPDDAEAVRQVEDATGCRVRPVVTGYRDIAAALRRVYADDFSAESRLGLLHRQPSDSASYTLTPAQRRWLAALGLLALAGLALSPRLAVVGLNALVQALYLVLTLFYLGLAAVKVAIVARPDHAGAGIDVTDDELAALRRADLPVYTVLVPAYREGRVLPILARALSELDYPHDRLDVKLLLEEDDTETIAVARALRLPNFIEIVTVPASEPRTKPKACNYGLQLARGAYTVIFDAEDIPERDQLLKVVAGFRKAGPTVACIQAKLAYFNRRQSVLTRWFTSEYLMWFDLLLPALQAARLPIPLGGTSNHFRTDVLRAIGAWDPYNVTEDADLGIRLHKAGYQTAVVDATTYEEATAYVGNWVRQRSRWIKGYMQTWLVHMRHPLALRRAMGTRAFVGFQLIVGGTPVTLLLNPVYATLTTLWYLTHVGVLQALFPGWVYMIAAANLFVGNFAFTYANMAAVARRRVWDIIAWTALSPLYWTLMSIAAWKALAQLITRPSYWEKTEHGLASSALIPSAGGTLAPLAAPTPVGVSMADGSAAR